jgi:hypothetical protein
MSSAPLSGLGIFAPAADFSSQEQRDLDYYLAPSRGKPAAQRLDWLKNMITEGTEQLKKEAGYPPIANAQDIIAGQSIMPTPGAACTTFLNLVRTACEEAVAIMSNVRAFWNVMGNDRHDPDQQKQAMILNKCHAHIYHRTGFPMKLKEGLEYAFVEGTGYLSPQWRSDYYRRGEGEIDTLTHGAMAVIPVQMYRKDLQSAYTMVIKENIPIVHLHRILGDKAKFIGAEGSAGEGSSNLLTTARSFFASLTPRTVASPKSGEVEVAYAYIDDLALNTGTETRYMGDWKDGRPLNSWSYEVPPLGKLFRTGWNADGSIATKIADEYDSLLYPQKRLMIASQDRMLYDGPNWYWHGRMPAIKLTVNEWAWNYLGLSLVAEALGMNQSHADIFRGIVDLVNTKLNPPIIGNSRIVSKKLLKAFNPRAWGKNKIHLPTDQGNPIIPAIDMKNLTLEAFYPGFLETINGFVKKVFGLPDLQALAKAKQVPGEGSIEKLASLAGDVIQMRENMLNAACTEYGMQVTSMIFQFYDARRLLTMLGPDGLSEEMFDFDPGTLVPGNLPHEPEALDTNGAAIKGVYASTRSERARMHGDNFNFHTEPDSLLRMTALQNKLMKIQARKISPLLVSVEDLAKTLEIHNWGSVKSLLEHVKSPETMEGNTVGERAVIEMATMREFQTDSAVRAEMMKMMLAAMQQQAGIEPQGGGGGKKGGGGTPGRPNSNAKGPQLANKGDRSTVTTS